MTRTDADRRTLRQLLERPDILVVPGAYDAIGARLIEQAGFDAVYMTGGGVSVSLGFPDFGLLDMGEMVDAARVIARSVSIPLIADADTGYGNELNVTRTVREYEAVGVAALQLEDQVSPKRCGHLEGKELVPLPDFVSKITAAVEARRSDLMVIARTDAVATHGLDEAVDRMNAGFDAGADIAFVEAPGDLDQLASIPARVRGPCLLNLVPGGRTPLVSMAEAQDMGYRVTILPGLTLIAALQSIDLSLASLRDTGRSPESEAAVAEVFGRFGLTEWNNIRSRFSQPRQEGGRS